MKFNFTKKYCFLTVWVLMNVLFFSNLNAQVAGDYRYKANTTGTWATLANWQKYDGTVGGTWGNSTGWAASPELPTTTASSRIFGTSQATVDADASIGALQVDGILIVNATKTLTVSGALIINGVGKTSENNGTIALAANSFSSSNGTAFTNTGAITLSGAFNLNGGTSNTSFTNTGSITQSVGAFNIQSPTAPSTTTFNNNTGGIITKTIGGNLTVNVRGILENAGTITQSTTAGDFVVNGTLNNNMGGIIVKEIGNFNVSAGAVVTNALTATIDKKVGSGFLSIAGSLTNHGTINSTAGNAFNVNTNTGTLTNELTGIITKSTTFNVGQTNVPSSTGTFINKGTFNNEAGSFIVHGASTLDCRLGSTLKHVSTNAISVPASGATLTFAGTYSGTGSFGGATFVNTGIVAPGLSPGQLGFNNGFTNSGTISAEINGLTANIQFDRINTNATAATINGTINLTFGFTPAVGNTFKIVNGMGTYSGTPTIGTITPSNITATYNSVDGVITITSITSLPIELIKFEAKTNKSITNLTWATASEKNNAQFEVQHATNGIDFQTISIIKGVGTTNVETVYNYDHSTPSVGINYYRLKQTDFDGTTDFSAVRSVVFGKNKFVLKTTLVQNQLTFVASGDEVANLAIFNSAGQQVLNAKVQGEQMIDVSNLPSGMYIVRMAGETARFVKQ